MSPASAPEGRFCGRIAHVEREAWNACFADEAESHEYYSACESAGTSHPTGAVSVSLDRRVVAVAPVFSMRFRLDSSFQDGDSALSRFQRRLARRVDMPFVAIGSPFAERCHIGLHAGLDSQQRHAALQALISTVEHLARDEGVRLIAVKDVVGDADNEVARILASRGYVRIASLPIAVLDLKGIRHIDEYLARLSSSTRRDLRRKQQAAAAVRIEDRHDITGVAPLLVELYDNVRRMSRLDYGELEELPPDYFLQVSRELGERALFRLYWVGSTLAAFNLLLIERDRIIDKFLGMRYPLARACNVYALSWLENVRLCLNRGVHTLQTGQTAYREKVRLGSHLLPSSIWFKHRGPVMHQLLRACAPLASFERNDPELAAVSRRRSA
jgi:predicted N-acyltransferase